MNIYKSRIIIFVCSLILITCNNKVDHKTNEANDDKPKKSIAMDYIKLGEAQKDDHYKAIEYFTKAIELDPNSSEAYSLRAFRKHMLNDFYGAMLDYNVSIKLKPNDYGSYINRGTLKYNQSDYRGAKIDYQNALVFSLSNLDSAGSYYNIGLTQYALNEYKTAIVSFSKSIYLIPHDLVYNQRALSKFMVGDYYGAIKDYNKTIEFNPDNREAYYNRGLCKLSLNQKENGCIDLSKAGELGYDKAYKAIQDFCK